MSLASLRRRGSERERPATRAAEFAYIAADHAALRTVFMARTVVGVENRSERSSSG
jgi:hypothetical protein